jgi:hypothetical protein
LTKHALKASHRGSDLANKMWRASVLGKGCMGVVGDVHLRVVEVVIRPECRRGTRFAHLVTLSPLSFSHTFSSFNTTPSLLPDHPKWVLYPRGLMVVGGGGCGGRR